MRKMTEGSVARHLIGYAAPLILGNFFQLAYNAVDTVILGKFAGERALAAASAANPVMTVVVLGVSGVSIGASVLMSRFYGAGDEPRLRREVATSLILGVAASAVVFALGLLLSGWVLRALSVPVEILALATRYLRIIFLGFPFTFLYNLLAAALRSVGDARTPTMYLMLASALNAALDLPVVGLLGWGVTGSAMTTVVAQAFSALMCARHIRRHVPLLHLARDEWRVDRALLRETVSSGAVTALQQACQPVGKVLIQRVINAQGVAFIAAFQAVTRVDDFACIPEQSISSGMMTCIAQNRGAGQPARVRRTLRVGMLLEIGYGVAILLAVQLGKLPIMRLFAAKDSAQMVQMGVDYLSLMAFFYVLPGLNNGMQGFFRGMGAMRTTLVATLIQISVRVLVVRLLVPRVGLRGAAWACAIGWSCMLVFTAVRYRALRGQIGDALEEKVEAKEERVG